MQILQHSALNNPFLSAFNVSSSQALTHNSRFRERGRGLQVQYCIIQNGHATIYIAGCQFVKYSGVLVSVNNKRTTGCD